MACQLQYHVPRDEASAKETIIRRLMMKDAGCDDDRRGSKRSAHFAYQLSSGRNTQSFPAQLERPILRDTAEQYFSAITRILHACANLMVGTARNSRRRLSDKAAERYAAMPAARCQCDDKYQVSEEPESVIISARNSSLLYLNATWRLALRRLRCVSCVLPIGVAIVSRLYDAYHRHFDIL